MSTQAGAPDSSSAATAAERPARRVRAVRVLLAAALVVVWLAIGALGGPLVGKLSQVQDNNNSSFLPPAAESTKVANIVATMSDTSTLPYFVLVQRADKGRITAADRTVVTAYARGIHALPFAIAGYHLSSYLAGAPPSVLPSADGKALLVPVSIDADKADDAIGKNSTPLFQTAQALRDSAAKSVATQGLRAYVTGPGGELADFVTAFAGIDGILLLVALVVVFAILLVVYRSPILPVAVLLGAVFGLAAAVSVVYPLAKHGTLHLNGQSQGILSILVVGAATDYSLLLVSRYREALHHHQTPWQAMRAAWRAAVEPISASAATVVLGLLCLLLSTLGNTKGLGPIGALGIAGAYLSALTFLPAVLLLIGRRAFWPLVPRYEPEPTTGATGMSGPARRGIWTRIADMVGAHPRRTWVITLVLLLACAAFVPTFRASGTSQSALFLDKVDSVTGQNVLAAHFPGGSGSPVQVVAPSADTTAVLARLKADAGLTGASVSTANGTPLRGDGDTLLTATLRQPADSTAAKATVTDLRRSLDPVSTQALVGGDTATNVDTQAASNRDLRVIIPAILLVILIVLTLLLRSIVASVVLVIANVISFSATLGVSAIAFNHVFGYPGADPAIPLYAFVFLVALGIDYSIFLMTRVREESAVRSSREGMLHGLAVTGGVITSAGVVLAATFSALSVIPILFLAQIAFLVAFGVLLDTIVVRSLLVPSIALELGDRVWWPGRPGARRGRHAR